MTNNGQLRIEPLARAHYRSGFTCGIAELDRYLQRQAGQDMRRRVARVFICRERAGEQILGYYTLSALAIDASALPSDLARKLPRHPLPAALIGRLAVAKTAQGKGIGQILLADAIQRTVAASEQIAVYAMVVDAKNDAVRDFYLAFGFRSFPSQPMRLFLSLASVPL